MEGDASSFHAAQVVVLADIARGTPLPAALASIVNLIEQQASGMLCSVLLFDEPNGRLRHGAAPHLPRAYIDELDGSAIGPTAGSCGAAAYHHERIVVEDIATHPNWTGYHHLALPYGLVACWSTPIFSPERAVLGTFAMYYGERRGPTAQEIAWVDAATHLASIAIVRSVVEDRLYRSEAEARQLAQLYAVSSAVGEALVRVRDPMQLYETACRIAVEKGLAVLAWVGIHDEARGQIVPVVRFGNDNGYIDSIFLEAHDDRRARGPAAEALRTGRVAISSDILNDPTFLFKTEAAQHGLRSCAVFPFRHGGRQRALFVIYRDAPHAFAEEERVLSALTDDISFAIESAETGLDRQRLVVSLNQRVNELTLLRRASHVLQVNPPIDDRLLGELAGLIPSAFDAPDHYEARIRWAHLEAHTPGWCDSQFRLEATLAAGAEDPTNGTIEVIYHGPSPPPADGPFLREEVAVIRSLADMMSSHFGRARAEAALREREERLQLLHDMSEAIRAAGDPGEVLAIATRMLGSHLRVSRCGYAEIDADGDHFTVAPGYHGDHARSIAGASRLSDYGPWFADAMRRGGAAVVVRDVDAELGARPGGERFKRLVSKAFICCTLIRQGVPRAMMSVQHDAPRDWTASEIRIVEEVVERCWAMIEQRSAENKLHRNEALLRIAGRAAQLGGWSVDLPSGRVTWSDEVCAIHEIPAGAAPTLEQALAFYHPEHRDLVRATVEACARDGTPFDLEVGLVTATERQVWVRAIGLADRDHNGAITRIHGAFQDVSERRRLEDQLRQAQKMEAIGRLASGVAHDFNNVLSVILSYSSFLVDDLPPGDSVRSDVEQIKKAGERAGQLTRQLLAFSRQQILQPRVIALDHILAGLEIMLRRMVGEAVALALHSADSVGNVVADPGQLEQVIMNLVVNARDAMPAGGSLTIELTRAELDAAYAARHPGVTPGSYVLLAVADSGIGMDAATRMRIFEPFFTTKDKGKGTGLGLSTVYGIVNQSGGHIWVDSEPGKGTTFKVYFPRVDAPIDVVVADERPRALRGSETVLLVEDDDQVRKIAGAILRRAGYFVFEAQNAGEALLIAERYNEELHVLVADVIMPRMGGRELAERLTRSRPEMHVLYISGYPQDEIVHDGALATDAAFLAKPITPDVLLDKMREVLDAAQPVARAEPAEPARRPARRSTPPAGAGRHILHIDDEEALIHLTARILKRLGYRVSSFTEPVHALKAFRDEPTVFDAVVTDVTMRGMTGFELVREVWATRPEIPVVVTSGDFRPEDIRIAEAMRIRDLVVKPDTVEELGHVLHQLFTRHAS